jgi:hypothetical protein
MSSQSQSWSSLEVEAVVADYFHMLTLELSGQAYNKTAHRNRLKSRLEGRSDGSIERKHQNISAILIESGCPYVAGYKPLGNYQSLLRDTVIAHLETDTEFDRSAISAAEQPAAVPIQEDFENLLVPPPELIRSVREPSEPYRARATGVFRDYLDREVRNRSLGRAGEEFVVSYERARLRRAGEKVLCERVELVAASKGDGLGYDVLSFEVDGRERFIEVKTTSFGKQTPFFLSRNELDFSKAAHDRYHLYRVFEFRRQPRMFDLVGAVGGNCMLDPVTYRASFG